MVAAGGLVDLYLKPGIHCDVGLIVVDIRNGRIAAARHGEAWISRAHENAGIVADTDQAELQSNSEISEALGVCSNPKSPPVWTTIAPSISRKAP